MALADWLAEGPLLTDGAWGTELQKRGLEPGACGDAWNVQRREEVLAVAREYVEAGSRVILTNTFRANRITLAAHGLATRLGEINRSGVAISREAAAGRALVFASLGPSGKLVAAGEIKPSELRLIFEEQVSAIERGQPDAILIETISDLEEARIALAAARQTRLPVIVSFVFDSGKNKDRTMTGLTPEQAARAMEEAGAAAIGANCGRAIEAFVPLSKRLKEACGLPVWIKPNAGMPELVAGRLVYPTDPEAFASHVPALIEAGASFVGGCCGSNPDFIRAMAKILGKCATN